jgi:uncharacterized membrane protein
MEFLKQYLCWKTSLKNLEHKIILVLFFINQDYTFIFISNFKAQKKEKETVLAL